MQGGLAAGAWGWVVSGLGQAGRREGGEGGQEQELT